MELPIQDPGGGEPAPPPDPSLILILNLLLFGCVGYWLLGQRGKAIAAAILWIAGLATCGVVSGIVAAIAAWDGYVQAMKLRSPHHA